MTKIKIEKVFNHLNDDLRKALEETIKQHFSGKPFDSREIFKTFQSNTSKRCSTWVRVPDVFVEKE
jgi:hypothetical protein